jgi:CheY-like chemotaxis protein
MSLTSWEQGFIVRQLRGLEGMGKKILLADDSITIQKVIELTFSDEDFEVVTVGNGRLAIERVQDVRPDLVLCDIIMPEKDGYEVCDFIKKHPSLSHVPVLLLTGAFEPFDQERATRVGCDGFLAKPFEPQTLIAKVKDLLNRSTTPTASAPAATAAAPAPEPAAPVYMAPGVAAPLDEERPPWAAPPPSPPEPPATSAWTAPEPAPAPVTAPSEDPATPVWTPSAPAPAAEWSAPAPSEEPSFFTEEALAPEPAPVAAAEPAVPAPAATEEDFAGLGLEDFSVEYGAPPAPPPSSSAFEAELYPLEDAGREELLPVSADEAADLQVQTTMEVPLEERARASVDARMESESLFEEVFDEPTPPSPPPVVLSAYAPAVEPEPEPEAEPAVAAPPPPAESLASLAVEPADEADAESVAAQIGIQPDVVSQIAQRVVAQISEKVIREIAWEVIPDLAETLIKKEIERLKADLG